MKADDALPEKRASYPLGSESWMGVTRAGARQDVSIAEGLNGAHEIDDLDWAAPLESSAILAMLTALVRDAFHIQSENDLLRIWRRGHFSSPELDSYLERNRENFDLFDTHRPFYQAAGLDAASGGPKPVTLIQPEVATGNNVPLFSTADEAHAPPISPAAAARRLIACHAWDTASIKTGAAGDPQVRAGKTTGNPVGSLGQLGLVVLCGRNLFETILLNTKLAPVMPEDRPAWRAAPAPNQTWSTRAPLGDLDLGTWQSRRVRLFPEVGSDGGLVVSGVLVCAGDRLLAPDARLEWRTGWRRVEKPKPDQPPYRPHRWQPGRAAWRGLPAVLAVGEHGSESAIMAEVLQQAMQLSEEVLPDNYPLGVQLVGVIYGNQAAVIEDVIADRTPLPVVALRERGLGFRLAIDRLVAQAEEVARALNNLGDNARLAVGGEKIPWDKGQRAGERLLHVLRPHADRLLAELGRHPEDLDEALLAWQRLLRREAWAIADPIINGLAPQAFLGRIVKSAKKEDVGLRQSSVEGFFRYALNQALPESKPRAPDQLLVEEATS